jgi:hypothetical protein
MSTMAYALWLAGPLTQLALIALMVRGKLRVEYPLFFSFVVFDMLATIALFGFWQLGPLQYFYAYWALEAVGVLLSFLVIRELFVNALKPYAALRDLGSMLFVWAGIVLLLGGTVIALSSPGNAPSQVMTAILSAERSIRLTQVGLLLFLLLFAHKLGLTWRHHVYGFAFGFGIFAAADLVLVSLRTQFGGAWAQTYSLLHGSVYLFAIVLWTAHAALKEPARELTIAAERPILQRWNEVLLATGFVGGVPMAEPENRFLGAVEQTVDRVLRNDIRRY